jgi:hypothetical protein
MNKLLMIVLLTAGTSLVSFAQNTSVYTSLKTKDCKTIESNTEGAGWYRGLCPGAGGYKLELTEGDLRQSIIVIAPGKKEFDLEFMRISSRFSAVGERAEWRMKGQTPVGLIVRFNVSVDDEGGQSSSLIVIKISKSESCVTEVIGPSKSQNVLARRAADNAKNAACKVFED